MLQLYTRRYTYATQYVHGLARTQARRKTHSAAYVCHVRRFEAPLASRLTGGERDLRWAPLAAGGGSLVGLGGIFDREL